VVTPVGTVKSPQGSFTIGGNQSGPVTAALRSALVSIQRGDAADPHGWVHRIG
ncbi:MAG: branched chain amino acid aminotransferase, partial [Blastomonas fulva]